MDDIGWPPSLLAMTTFVLSRAGRLARSRLSDRLADRQMRLWHVAVLAALHDFGPLVQRDLSTRLGIDPSDLVQVLDELETAGRVERRRDPDDRRRYQVVLTRGGRSTLAAVGRDAASTHDAMLAPLDPAEREQLRSLLLRVLAHIDPQAARPS